MTWEAVMAVDRRASYASWMENFPWTRLPGVAMPEEAKPQIPALAGAMAAGIRERIGDGNYHGLYQRGDDDMLAIWQVAVAETRALIERGVVTDTLPDLLRDGLDVVFVGINPSLYSVERGHYFARRSNRFWPGLSRSALSARAREGLGVALLDPAHDDDMLAYGIGFTDLVKRATVRADEVTKAEFAAGVDELAAKLEQYRPRFACFHGVTGYRHVQLALTGVTGAVSLGPQPLRLGATRLFVVPNPSGANAHFTPADQTHWYDRLAKRSRGAKYLN